MFGISCRDIFIFGGQAVFISTGSPPSPLVSAGGYHGARDQSAAAAVQEFQLPARQTSRLHPGLQWQSSSQTPGWRPCYRGVHLCFYRSILRLAICSLSSTPPNRASATYPPMSPSPSLPRAIRPPPISAPYAPYASPPSTGRGCWRALLPHDSDVWRGSTHLLPARLFRALPGRPTLHPTKRKKRKKGFLAQINRTADQSLQQTTNNKFHNGQTK